MNCSEKIKIAHIDFPKSLFDHLKEPIWHPQRAYLASSVSLFEIAKEPIWKYETKCTWSVIGQKR